MKQSGKYPVEHDNTILEKISERYFRNVLPVQWLVDTPSDYGIDLIVGLVVNNEVIGLNFSVQLKAKNDCKGKIEVSLKKTTLNYLFSRLEPAMLVLYDEATKKGYWKWLIKGDFDLTLDQASYLIKFDTEQCLEHIDWEDVKKYVQRIFKTHQNLSTSLEYDLFNSESELEVRAWAHYVSRNFPEAIFNFRRLVDHQYKPVWLLALAQCEYQNFEYDKALHSINLALEIDQSDDIYLAKACILSESGKREDDVFKVKAAEKIFAQLYEKSPTAVNCYNYANTLQNLGRLDESKKLYLQATKLDRNYAEAWRNLGQIHFDQSEYPKALECYEASLRINPELIQAIASKGIVLGAGFKKYQEALDLLNETMIRRKSVFTEFPEIFYWLSYFNAQLGHVDDALTWINRGLDHSPGDRYFRGQKAQIFIHMMALHPHILDQAITFFEENEAVNSNDSINVFYWSEALLLQLKKKEARTKLLTWYGKHLQIVPSNVIERFETTVLQFPLLNWKMISGHLILHPVENYKNVLRDQGLLNSDLFIAELQITRVIFLSDLYKAAESFTDIEILRQRKVEFTDQFLNSLSSTAIGKFVVTNKDEDREKFAKEFSETAIGLTMVMIQEIAKCTGFVIGHLYPGDDSIIKALTNESVFTTALLAITHKLYIEFDLPMGD